jgi:hypothetical protein
MLSKICPSLCFIPLKSHSLYLSIDVSQADDRVLIEISGFRDH